MSCNNNSIDCKTSNSLADKSLGKKQKNNLSKRLNKIKLFKAFDIVIIVLLLCLVVATIFLFFSKQGTTAQVYINGELTYTLELSKNKTIHTQHLDIIVKDGKIGIVDSDCPEKLCQKAGFISAKGASIVCLPNKVVIKIVGKGEVEAIT